MRTAAINNTSNNNTIVSTSYCTCYFCWYPSRVHGLDAGADGYCRQPKHWQHGDEQTMSTDMTTMNKTMATTMTTAANNNSNTNSRFSFPCSCSCSSFHCY
jgi:hypothetical protein